MKDVPGGRNGDRFLFAGYLLAEFRILVQRYNKHENAVFVPEARLDMGPFNMFYAYGEAWVKLYRIAGR